ncbi:MAG: four-carbon acid sugar kinase family protein [Devosiaceae bacterium]|nr:four-carbon acid sugar kinase family protein [Devosiaceae bacterium MH13]
MSGLPDGRLLAWYGDDFTGSASVMEEVATAGLETVLFLRIPTSDELLPFAGARVIGLAGTARAHSPAWMKANLPPAFAFLKELGAALNLYKICSTLDSSPQIGSIGTAITTARATFGDGPVPVFPASPKHCRFQCFGDLYASAGEAIYRLDRHPVVSKHPVTPMHEANVARHLARQTDEAIGELILSDLPTVHEAWRTLADASNTLITVDAGRDDDLLACGHLFLGLPKGSLVVGSQGVAEALVAVGSAAGELSSATVETPVGPSARMVALSGSLSPTTSKQIERALAEGFTYVPLDMTALLGPDRHAMVAGVARSALDILSAGGAPLIASARGPDDPAVAAIKEAARQAGVPSEDANIVVGTTLGAVLDQLVRAQAIDRVAIAGGDTSGYVLKQLDGLALTFLASFGQGTSLYRLHPGKQSRVPLEISLKGGQMGAPDYFQRVRLGKVAG